MSLRTKVLPGALALLLAGSSAIAAPLSGIYDVIWDDVKWKNSEAKPWLGSMPLGNGDLGLNAWVEEGGDLLLLVGKTNAWSENGQLLKLGRIRLHLDPTPPVGKSFRQVLRPEEGCVDVYCPADAPKPLYKIWVDANRPVAHVEVRTADGKPTAVRASLELWRDAPRELKKAKGRENEELQRGLRDIVSGGDDAKATLDPDTVLPPAEGRNRIAWCHRNARSFYPALFANQHLDPLLAQHPDPLLGLASGAVVQGPGFVNDGDRALKLATNAAACRLDLYALVQAEPDAASWGEEADILADTLSGGDIETARAAHRKWWRAFWDRSWIVAEGAASANAADAEAARAVTQGYAMQRWMDAGSGRAPAATPVPIKPNGAIFTAGQEGPRDKYDPAKGDVGPDFRNPDYRSGGAAFRFQSLRQIYWPMLASGDYDLMLPLFRTYRAALPLAAERTRLAFKHGGAAFPETFLFWGTPNDADFGFGNKDVLPANPALRYQYQGGLELVAMMLDYYDATQDADFLTDTLLPVATAVAAFYDEHWPRGADGKIAFNPAQALETYQSPSGKDVANPLPDIAGLASVLPRLIALPSGPRMVDDARRAAWKKTLAALPPLPKGKTGTGKNNAPDRVPIPSTAQKDDGAAILLPAQVYGKDTGAENPEEYAIFPYRLYGVGLPDIDLGLNTYRARNVTESTGPSCDGIVAACLGLAEEAQTEAVRNLAEDKNTADNGHGPNYPNLSAWSREARFKWFWKPTREWEPDMANGGAGQGILQNMLLQPRNNGAKLLLFPAWPKEWNVSFKLHAARNTTVEGVLRNGKLESLVVTPPERRADVIVMEPQ